MSDELTAWLAMAADALGEAKVKRARGDAFAKRKDAKRSSAAFGEAAELLESVLKRSEFQPDERLSPENLSKLQQDAVVELIELYGSLGGIYSRLDDKARALKSYEVGARLEQQFCLPGTYNRLNAIKFKLLTGAATLKTLKPELQDLGMHIKEQLAENSELSDSGWAWADLGDSLLLSGDLPGAKEAYQAFVNKAETNSPRSAIRVLDNIAGTLEGSTDADAAVTIENIISLKQELE